MTIFHAAKIMRIFQLYNSLYFLAWHLKIFQRGVWRFFSVVFEDFYDSLSAKILAMQLFLLILVSIFAKILSARFAGFSFSIPRRCYLRLFCPYLNEN